MPMIRRPSWFSVLLTLSGTAAFILLGIWQLDRASYKEHLLAHFEHASAARAVPFARVAGSAPGYRYMHVEATGHYLANHIYMWDDQTEGELVGVDVYVPFAVADHERPLLVNLGFLRHGSSELDRPPQVPRLRNGTVTIHGLYAPMPPPGFKIGGDQLLAQRHYPKMATYLDLDVISRDLGRNLQPGILLLDQDPRSGYIRQWTPTFMPPERHQAYAFQWFSFAAAALVIFFAMHRQKPRDAGSSDDHHPT